jgi:hypothetical protein
MEAALLGRSRLKAAVGSSKPNAGLDLDAPTAASELASVADQFRIFNVGLRFRGIGVDHCLAG